MIGETIRELRELQGMTQSEMAKALKISSKAVMNWENDLSLPSARKIIEIAALFHISTDMLLGVNTEEYVSLKKLSPKNRKIVLAMISMFEEKFQSQD